MKYIATFKLHEDPEVQLTMPVHANSNGDARGAALQYSRYYLKDNWVLVSVKRKKEVKS